jgi:hypothetical protein
MKYDDASWHYGGDFPDDLPSEAGATHIGMFVAWCMMNGLAGSLHIDEFPDTLESLRSRQITPGQFIIEACDEKFTDEDLNDDGNAFASAYYDLQSGQYVNDYEATLASTLPTIYHTADSWDNYDKLAPIISRQFDLWKQGKLTKREATEDFSHSDPVKPWWKFW